MLPKLQVISNALAHHVSIIFMETFLCFFIAVKTDSKLTLQYMLKNFIIQLNEIKFKI